MTFLSISIREKCVPFFPHFHEKLRTRREREREREERGSVRRRAKMMKGAAVAMISALAKTTSAIEANVGRRRVTRLEGWMHSAWKIMRSYARARASWIMQGGYTTEPRADRGLKCQPRAGLPSFVRNKERNTRRKPSLLH